MPLRVNSGINHFCLIKRQEARTYITVDESVIHPFKRTILKTNTDINTISFHVSWAELCTTLLLGIENLIKLAKIDMQQCNS